MTMLQCRMPVVDRVWTQWRQSASRLAPARMLLALSVVFGVIFSLLTPPFQAPDEFNHFFRAYQISEGGLVAIRQGDKVGGNLPVSLTTLAATVNPDLRYKLARRQSFPQLLASFAIPLQPTVRQFTEFPNTALYSPIPYLPQAAGIALGRCCALPPLWLLYLGRWGNLACWVALVVLAVTLIPVGPWTLCALALSPMALFLGASLSPDGVVNGLAMLFLALVLQSAVGTVTLPLSRKRLGALLGLAVLLALAKQTYLPMVLLILLIPLSHFGTPRRAAGFLLAFLLVIAAAWGGWMVAIRPLFVPLQPQVSPSLQLHFLLSHPAHFFQTLVTTYQQPLRDNLLVGEYVGVLGWLDTHLPSWCYAIYLWALGIVAFTEVTRDRCLSIRQRSLLLLIPLLTFLTINLFLYLSWTAVGYTRIGGLQGRYFIPIVPCLLLGLFTRSWQPRHESPLLLAALRCLPFLCVLCVTALVLLGRYYGR